MSALGGGRASSEDLSRAIRDVVDELKTFTMGASRAGKAIADFSGVTSIVNRTVMGAFKFGSNALGGAIEDTMRFGGRFGDNMRQSALRSLADLPFDPTGAGKMYRPLEAAENRVLGIVGPIARAGGQVDDSTVSALMRTLYSEEGRAEQASQQVGRIARRFGSRLVEGRSGDDAGAFWADTIGGTIGGLYNKVFGVSMR